jgi:hypothetical protein
MKKGFSAILTIFLVIILTLGLALTFVKLGNIGLNLGVSLTNSIQADFLARSCGFAVLLKLKDFPEYQGGENFNLDQGRCTIFPREGNVFKIEGELQKYFRKIKIEIEDSSFKWEEVADF